MSERWKASQWRHYHLGRFSLMRTGPLRFKVYIRDKWSNQTREWPFGTYLGKPRRAAR